MEGTKYLMVKTNSSPQQIYYDHLYTTKARSSYLTCFGLDPEKQGRTSLAYLGKKNYRKLKKQKQK